MRRGSELLAISTPQVSGFTSGHSGRAAGRAIIRTLRLRFVLGRTSGDASPRWRRNDTREPKRLGAYLAPAPPGGRRREQPVRTRAPPAQPQGSAHPSVIRSIVGKLASTAGVAGRPAPMRPSGETALHST